MTPAEEGHEAAVARRTFQSCPYTFDKSGVDADEFNRTVRKKMDEWFAAWKAELARQGLGFNMRPILHKKKASDQ